MTLKLVLALRPSGLVAVHVTWVTPGMKHEPGGGAQATVAPQGSVTAGVVKVAMPQLAPVGIMTATGLWVAITGGCISFTVTVKEHVALLLEESVAVQVTVVTPCGKVLPEGGEQVAVIVPSQLSFAVTVP